MVRYRYSFRENESEKKDKLYHDSLEYYNKLYHGDTK